jgi:hypothetical protein
MSRSAFIHSTHLLVKRLSSMVFEHLKDLFDPENSISNFSQLFLVCFYVVVKHILGSITKALNATRLLALAKVFNGRVNNNR